MALKEEELQAKLKELTAEIVSDLSALDAAHSKELLGEHLRTCVAENLRQGNDEVIDELVNVLQKLMK